MSNNQRYLFIFPKSRLICLAIFLSLSFLVFSLVFFEAGGKYMLLIPAVLLVALLALISIENFLLIIVFLVPSSVQLIFIIPDTPVDIFLPTEVMLAALLVLMIFKVLIGREINRKILLHPVSIVSYCILGWSLFTSLTGALPIVSIKSFITKLWFFAGFYLLAAQLFRKQENIRKYFIAYIAGIIPVVIYYLIRMWQAGIFNQKAAYKSIRPFFNDHTSFGAALAFCIPVIIYLISNMKTSKTVRGVLIIMFPLFSAAFLFSYSRAAWLSLALAGIVASVLLLRVSWKMIFPLSVTLAIIILFTWSAMVSRLYENRQNSSDNIKSHLQSISNIRSDASNMERINRWKAAFKMFSVKPILGWGPATYQFEYAPFQMAEDKTIISTNYGEGGNAHSEYLGSLVDSGIPGLFFYMMLLYVVLRRAILIMKVQKEKKERNLLIMLVAGLTTYVVHGALNNFLDTDKISALFWGMIAAIVAIDIRLQEERQEEIDDKKGGLPEVGSNN